MNRPPDRRSRPTAVIASSEGVLVYSGRMADPICARLVTAAMKPIVETASAVYASPAQRYSTPASSSFFRCLSKASGSSRMPTTAPSFIPWPPELPLSHWHNKVYSLSMSIAVTEEHRVLAQTVADFLAKHQARAMARGLLESDEERLPGFWTELAGLGLLGIHLPEELGGAGFTLSEVLVVAEQLGRVVAPGPFVPTVITSALITAAAPEDLRRRLLPGLADGGLIGAAALGGDVAQADGAASGNAGVVISGALADILLVPSGDDVLVVEKALGGVAVTVPANLDPSRRAAKVRLEAAHATVLPGARGLLTDIARTVFAAEAAGIAAEVTDQASDYAKTRVQFGRPIATFQAVKHHCANMLVAAGLAPAAAWDAGRAGVDGGDQLSYTAAIAATLAIPATVDNAQLKNQVHGGVGFTLG